MLALAGMVVNMILMVQLQITLVVLQKCQNYLIVLKNDDHDAVEIQQKQ